MVRGGSAAECGVHGVARLELHTSGLLGSDDGGSDGRRRLEGVRVLSVRAIDVDARSTCGRSLFLIDRCLRTADGVDWSAMMVVSE